MEEIKLLICAANLSKETAQVPIGYIFDFAGDIIPDGWIEITDKEIIYDPIKYPDLKIALNDIYGENKIPPKSFFRHPIVPTY